MINQNKNQKKENYRNIFRDAKFLIDQNIYKFLLFLMKTIFIVDNKKSKTTKKNLEKCIEKVNEEIIGIKKYLQIEYSIQNFSNIINFVKTQNNIFYGEIVENLLIIVFGMAFKTEKENIFGRYIYNDIEKLKCNDNYILANWFNQKKFNSSILDRVNEARESYIKALLKNDLSGEDDYTKIQEDLVLFSFLKEINDGKCLPKEEKLISHDSTILSSNRSISCYTGIFSNFLYSNDIGTKNKIPINLARTLLISVYIYCQIKHSPLMEYIKESAKNKELAILPFSYDLSESVIEAENSNIIFAPVRIEPRIEELKMNLIYMRKKSFLEFSKALLFNQNIKKVYFHRTIIKSYYIDIIQAVKFFNNNSVEQLNLDLNYLKEDSSQALEYIISHYKKLKTLNLSSNDLKRGISPLLITLKNLYRKGETNLENLYLTNCKLDDIAFYELGELLKSKYCNLKKLYLNQNNIPSNSNFLKKLKKNRSLTEIYFSKGNIGNNNSDDIMRVISNCHLDYLYLDNNKINNFNQCLRILYRTKLVKSNEEKDDLYFAPYLYNLDLTCNICYNKNTTKLKLLEKGIKETQLYCLSFSKILFGLFPQIFNNNLQYKKEVDNLVKILQKEEKEYKDTCSKINVNEVNIKKINKIEYEEYFKKLEDEINNIINSKDSQFPILLKREALNLITDHKEIFNDIDIKKEIKKVHCNLVNYINLKKSKIILKELNTKKTMKKMILI